MPSQHKASANIGRKAQTGQPGIDDDRDHTHDASTTYNTELNKAYAERDRYKSLFERANKKLSDTHQAKDDLRTQAQGLKDDNANLQKAIEDYQEANQHLLRENEALGERCTTLEDQYNSLLSLYGSDSSGASGIKVQIPPHVPTPAPAPDLPRRSSRKSSQKESLNQHQDRSRKRDKEPKGHKGDKVRFSTHSEPKPTISSSKARPSSFIEGWGPGPGPSRSHATGVRVSRTAMPAMSPGHDIAYSAVPRTVPPLSPRIYKSKGPTTASIYATENGDYVPYPVAR